MHRVTPKNHTDYRLVQVQYSPPYLWFQLLTVNLGPKISYGKLQKETIHKF